MSTLKGVGGAAPGPQDHDMVSPDFVPSSALTDHTGTKYFNPPALGSLISPLELRPELLSDIFTGLKEMSPT